METKFKKYNVKAELCKSLTKVDLQELCDATEEAILAGGGFGWVSPPSLKNTSRLLERGLAYTRKGFDYWEIR